MLAPRSTEKAWSLAMDKSRRINCSSFSDHKMGTDMWSGQHGHSDVLFKPASTCNFLQGQEPLDCCRENLSFCSGGPRPSNGSRLDKNTMVQVPDSCTVVQHFSWWQGLILRFLSQVQKPEKRCEKARKGKCSIYVWCSCIFCVSTVFAQAPASANFSDGNRVYHHCVHTTSAENRCFLRWWQTKDRLGFFTLVWLKFVS